MEEEGPEPSEVSSEEQEVASSGCGQSEEGSTRQGRQGLEGEREGSQRGRRSLEGAGRGPAVGSPGAARARLGSVGEA